MKYVFVKVSCSGDFSDKKPLYGLVGRRFPENRFMGLICFDKDMETYDFWVLTRDNDVGRFFLSSYGEKVSGSGFADELGAELALLERLNILCDEVNSSGTAT
jgi:hypothetical protein